MSAILGVVNTAGIGNPLLLFLFWNEMNLFWEVFFIVFILYEIVAYSLWPWRRCRARCHDFESSNSLSPCDQIAIAWDPDVSWHGFCGRQTDLCLKLAWRVFNASSYEMPLFMHSIQLKGLKIANSINKRMRFYLNIYLVLFGFEKITVGHFDLTCAAHDRKHVLTMDTFSSRSMFVSNLSLARFLSKRITSEFCFNFSQNWNKIFVFCSIQKDNKKNLN